MSYGTFRLVIDSLLIRLACRAKARPVGGGRPTPCSGAHPQSVEHALELQTGAFGTGAGRVRERHSSPATECPLHSRSLVPVMRLRTPVIHSVTSKERWGLAASRKQPSSLLPDG